MYFGYYLKYTMANVFETQNTAK